MSSATRNDIERLERRLATAIAVFAAVLAVTDLGAGKFGDDEIISHNEKTSAYAWYNTKSIKQDLAEGRRDLLVALQEAGAIQVTARGAVRAHVSALDAEIARYKKEKAEILKGSRAVGQANWTQDIGGELGKVTGAAEWSALAERLGAAGDIFDAAVLFLQLCLVMGAMGILLKEGRSGPVFFTMTLLLGVIGTLISVQAYRSAL